MFSVYVVIKGKYSRAIKIYVIYNACDINYKIEMISTIETVNNA